MSEILIINLLVLVSLGSTCWSASSNARGSWFLHDSSEVQVRFLCVSLQEKLGVLWLCFIAQPPFRSSLLFLLDCFSFVSAFLFLLPLSSVISYCLSLLFGTWGGQTRSEDRTRGELHRGRPCRVLLSLSPAPLFFDLLSWGEWAGQEQE